MIVGLSSTLPTSMASQLQANGVSAARAHEIASAPPVGSLFASFLGYNPMEKLLGSARAAGVTPHQWSTITGKEFFPHLISEPFHKGLVIAFWFAVAACVVAAFSSLLTAKPTAKHVVRDPESLGSELAAVSGEAGVALSELVTPDEAGDDRPGNRREAGDRA
jgi:hypothetical protein